MLAAIRKAGAKQVLEQQAADVVTWLPQISSGDARWLDVARALRPASDPETAVSLDHAVARALLKNPASVLRLLGKEFSFTDVCSSPYVKAPPERDLLHLQEAQRAVESVTTTTYRRERTTCLESLKRARQRVLERVR